MSKDPENLEIPANTAKILDGRVVRDEIQKRLKAEVISLSSRLRPSLSGHSSPTLAIIQVGDNPESSSYIEQKKKFGQAIGASVRHIKFSETDTEKMVIEEINGLNADHSIHGILVQMPLSKNFSKENIIESIASHKDVDGLTAVNVKKLWEGKTAGISSEKNGRGDGNGFIPATARAVVTLLDHYKVPIAGKHAVVIGRSELVGKPLSILLLNRNATVTICHSKTEGLRSFAKSADILIAAIGKPRFINSDHVSSRQTVIDVGVTIDTDGSVRNSKINNSLTDTPVRHLVGDVDIEAVKGIVNAISPVPGGVGPLTVASLFENLIQAADEQSRHI